MSTAPAARLRRLLTAGAGVALLLLGRLAAAPVPAAAAATTRAVLVVDFGDGATQVTPLRFAGASVTGIEALRLGGYDPAVRSFGGNGGAVCALKDPRGASGSVFGCSPDATCLTCGAPAYWSYFRAAPGAGSYTYSPAGAGATRVVDGSVEAWKWSAGTPPRFVSFASVFAPPSTSTSSSGATSTAANTATSAGAQPAAGTTRPATDGPTLPPPVPTTAKRSSPTTRAGPAPTVTAMTAAPARGSATGRREPGGGSATRGRGAGIVGDRGTGGPRAPAVDTGGGSVGSFAVLVAVAALLVALIVRARLTRASPRRRRPTEAL